jgi:hypothetical protein
MIAPFVRPTDTGKPTWTRQGSEAKMFKPAYIKPKDMVNPSEQFDRQPGDLFTDVPRTPQQNFDAEVAAIMAHHRDIIDRRWEWLAAQASIYGEVTVEYEDGTSVVVDFGRAAGHDVVKTSGNFWGDSGISILDDIQAWADTMTVADFGGIPNRLTVGGDVWKVMRKDDELLAEMDLTRRGNLETNIKTGLVLAESRDSNVRFVGTVGAGIDIYVYSDFYQNASGTQVPFMSPKDIVLTTPDVGGIPAFGAIADEDASLQPLPVFPKMWPEKDPSGMWIMTQSAPLFIPVYPNRTFRARVVG